MARHHDLHLGRHHPARTHQAPARMKGDSGMTHAHTARRRQHAMAARQALSLCEAELPAFAYDVADELQGCTGTHRGQAHISVLTARTALRAAGLPPPLAAALRSRLRIVPEPEARS
jgi:hypothetical protein